MVESTRRLWKYWKAGMKTLADFTDEELDELMKWEFLRKQIMEYRVQCLVEKGMGGIKEEILSCKRCDFGKQGSGIVGRGAKNPKVLFLSDSPDSVDTSATGCLTGYSRLPLEELISYMGLKQSEWAVTTAVKCVSDIDDNMPTQHNCGRCNYFLKAQIELLDPEIIVLLGEQAREAFTPLKLEIGVPKRFSSGKILIKFHHLKALNNSHTINNQKVIIDRMRDLVDGKTKKTYF